MIAFLRGKLISKAPTEVVVDVQGIGYFIHIPLSTYERVGEVGTETILFTYLHVREDALQLFGFATEKERKMFKLLLSVSGIGPRIAQGVLSGMSVDELEVNIVKGNVAALTAIQGVGRKTAERIVLELRDAVAKGTGISSDVPAGSTSTAEMRNEALLALISLGFTQQSAEKAIRAALHELQARTVLTVEELIKEALRRSGPK